MARYVSPATLATAPPSARPFSPSRTVEVVGVNGVRVQGAAMQYQFAEGSLVIILHRDRQYIGQVQFAQDFDHIMIQGSTRVFPLHEVKIVELIQ